MPSLVGSSRTCRLFALAAMLALAGRLPAQDKAPRTAAKATATTPATTPTANGIVAPTGEPVITPGHQRMLEVLEEVRLHMGENPFMPQNEVDALRLQLEPLGVKGLTDAQRIEKTFRLATMELKMGEEEESIADFQRAYNSLREPRSDANGIMGAFWMGVAYLRYAETQNCCARNTPDSCLLPIRGQGIHTDREGSTKAIEYFQKVLQYEPAGTVNYNNALWLMNIAHMTLGDYPDGVPEQYRVPPQFIESEEAFPRFMNVGSKVGLNVLNSAGGVIIDDFNNDDYPDVFVSQMYLAGQTRFWLNQRDGTFREVTEAAGLKGLYGGLNCIQADYNNDGNLDVLILRGGWMGPHGQHPNSLLRNNGDGKFSDVTFEAGLGEEYFPTQTGSWADYDGDGDLDLYVGNELSTMVTAPCQLFRNNGDGTFADVARAAGVTNNRYTKAVIFGDYDADGRPDIYVSNLDAENRLYHNNGDGTFTDLARQLGVTGPRDSFPAWFWDFDNDGSLDIYASSYQINSGHYAAQAVGQELTAMTQRLYRGDGHGGFDDVTERTRLNDFNAPMGANFGDLDNDGYLDFYLGTGRPDYWELMPNVMYHNRGGVDFADVTTAGGFGSLQKGHAIAFADIDHDGDQDVFSQLGGAYPGDKYYNALYENPGFGNHFLTVKLVGVTSNRSAIGARIHAKVVENGQTRSIYRHCNSGGTFGGNPLRQTLGLGKAEKVAKLEIFWPTTGRTQTFTDVPLDQHIRITEDAPRWEAIDVNRLTIGAKPKPKPKAVTAKPRGSATSAR